MSTKTTNRSDAQPVVGSRTAVTAAALVGAIGCAGYISTFVLLSDLSDREVMHAPYTVTVNVIATLGFVGLAVALAGLADRTRLPRWALSVAAAGCAFIAAITWTVGTFNAYMADVLTDSQHNELLANGAGDGNFLFDLITYPKIILCVVGFLSVAIIGWRRQAIARGACVLLALAGLVSLLPPPWPGALLAALGFAWTARSARPVSPTT